MPPPQRSGSANQRPSRGGGAGRGASGRGAAGRGSFGRGGASRGGSFGRGGAGRGSSFGRGGEGRGGRGAGRGSFGRGEGRGASGRGGADRGSAKRSTSALQLKKGKTSYHKEKFKRDRMEGREYRRPTEGGKPSYTKRSHSSEGDAQTHGVPHGHGTPKSSAPIDLHLASKISSELRADIATFKSRKGSNDNFGKELNRFFDLIPPMLVTQHLPAEVANFRSYLSRFQKGSANAVDAFMNWHEWASYEVNKGKTFHGASTNTKTKAEKEEEEAEAEGKTDSAPAEKEKKTSATQQSLAKTVREREHMKALLQMCVRHNSAKRKEGQHAFINHINHKLSSDEVDCRSLDRLRATGHHSVAYALSRLLLGMATDDMAQLVLHCHALYLVLTQTRITASVILALLDEEMALGTRMKAVQARLTKKDRKPASGEEDGEDDGDEDEDEIDPDDISDPTKGERNQRLTAAVFALGALVMSHASMSTEEARRVFIFLCFCYVEQKATRVASANLLFSHLQGMHESLLHDEVAMQWSTYAFFFYPKMEYFRPEALQLLLRLMERDQDKDLLRCLPPTVSKYLPLDPLEPTTLEQIANALFRKEQVTAVHPMVHPVWGDLLDLIQRRCAMGESLKEHVSSFVHNAIAPYRRGNADLPRRVLFQSLAGRLGQLIVQSEDADQRAEALHLASKNIGYGKRTAAKPTPLAELRNLSVESIGAKVTDLLRQYRITKDTDPAATVNRTWILRELRNCLSVPMPSGVVCSYVNEAAKALMDFGFLGANTRDTLSANRCIYMLADILSFTFSASVARPQCSWKALDIIHHYLSCEEKGRCRFDTAVNKSEFRKARNRIVEALEETSKRSVLFYESRDMEILFTLLFFVLSVDDGTNAEAVELAKHVIPDLCQFYVSGTLETLDLLLDVLMALIMRTASPMQVMPLMTFIRRNATGAILKFSKFIRSTASLNLLLAPLRDAYHTDSRELARQKKAKQVAGEQSEEDEEEEDSDDENGAAHAATAEDASGSEEDSAEEEDDEESDGDDGDDDASSITEKDEDGDESTDAESDSGDDNEDDDDSSTEGDNDEDKEDAADAPEEEDDDALEDDEADEAPTQQYLDALKGMVTNVDLDHHYASDTASKEKSDVVRAIQMVSRIGASMQSPLVVHLFQVLLAVCRENVKSSDEVVFASAMSAIEMLLLAKNRYFGTFVGATELFQLLGDIQSYCRKLERTLLTDRRVSAKAAAMIRGRMHKLKRTALRVFHYTAMLAYKNHAGEEVRVTFSEYYKSIFCDRGWDMKRILPNLKKDMYYYRQGFAWVLLPAALEKYDEVAVVEGPQRVRVFSCCCTLIEAMLPRFSGLPKGLKESCGAAVGQFLQSIALEDVYAFKHTAPYTFLHTIKMVIQYNNRVHLDTKWVETNIVNKAVDDDNIQLSGASIRTLASLERMLGMTPRAKETKAPVPVKVLYQQFEKLGEKEKTDFHRKAKKVRAKILKALLSHRNSDPTDAERATKRRRKEELRVEDRLQRQVLRQSTKTVLSKEERAEKRKRIMMAKQDRIAKNKLRKRQLHENRVRSFDRWREQKLAQAAANEE